MVGRLVGRVLMAGRRPGPKRATVLLPAGLLAALGLTAAAAAPAQERASVGRSAEVQPAFASENFAAAVDPRADGWDSEALSEQAEAQLYRVAVWIVRLASGAEREISAGDLAAVVDAGFETTGLLPAELALRQRGAAFTVRRGEAGPGSAAASEYLGVDGFARAVGELAVRLRGDDARAHLKVVGIEGGARSFTTRSRFEASVGTSSASGPARQMNAEWTTGWTMPEGGGDPLLLSVAVADHEETDAAAGALFVDVTEAAIGHNPSYRDQLLQPPDSWLNRLSKAVGYTKAGWQGVSVADVNGDGLDDIFLPEQGGLPNRLFVQRRDGTFDDRSAAAAVDYLERTLAGLFVDLDNDGDPDLVLSGRPAVLVLENDGRGGFARVRHVTGAIPDSNSLAAADYDNDGDLDLYVCAYRRAYHERGVASPVPYHDANNGGRNALLRNDGDFRFVDATAESGLEANNSRFSLAAAWEDFDDDGDQDLYVANDYGRNNLYRNDGGRFTDVAAAAGVEDISSGMSVSWADHDRDGRMDVYVGNMFSAAGNRITYQRKFERDRQRAGPLSEVQRMARGNSLFAGAPGGGFRDRSVEANVTMGRWSWSSVFADLDNDGWEDLVVANGNLTQTLPDDL